MRLTPHWLQRRFQFRHFAQATELRAKDEKVAFSGGEFQLNADRDGKAISLSGEAQSGRIDAVNEYNQKVQLTFNNLKTDGSSTLASFGERVGNQNCRWKK